MRLVIELKYRGSLFSGWQIQQNAISVQEVLQDNLAQLFSQEIEVIGCGRTDAGVHATQYFAHFDLDADLEWHLRLQSLNLMLPLDVAVSNIFQSPPDFHSRYDAVLRKYIYRIHLNKNPFSPFNSFYLREASSLSMLKLNECSLLISHLDQFSSFVKAGNDLENYKCNIFESRWVQINENMFEYHISANRFVRGMVRLIVGMCLNYALNKISMDQIKEDIQLRRQIAKSWSVNAEGLTLEKVQYPVELMDKLHRINFRI